jgi:hypothetical protein
MVVTATEEQSLTARLRRLIGTGRSDGKGTIAHFHRELARLAG